ncbi:MAG: DGQHR domain-containing protein, partial [Candidatus Marinimicrobia bacterium]|nr:DGQHR domain-containing protein [Candidatus Neomarinimicrobiota bacterium]
RLPKRHDIAFNDRVWALMARMGFSTMSLNDQFFLSYDDNRRRQIDVFAGDEEAVLIIECKSAGKRRRVDQTSEIREFIFQMEGLRNEAKKIFSRKHKVAFIWTTNNCVLGETDRSELRDHGIHHFNQDDIEYFEQLTDHLGSAGKYQLYGKLFENMKIPQLRNRFPAIEGVFANGEKFYSFNIEPEYLLKLGYILHRSDTSIETSNVYQRIIKKTRLNQIRKYINNGGYFANSIIINIEVRGRSEIKFEQASLAEHDSEAKVGVLHLPKVYRRAFIIDGQHRLYGFSDTKQRLSTVVPVIALVNISTEEQERMFIDINHEQKSVPANLLRSLMADFNFGSNDLTRAIPALKARILIYLNTDEDSPLYKRIKVSEEEGTQTRCLTLQTLITWGLNTKTSFFGELRGKNLVDHGNLLVFTGDSVDHKRSLEKGRKFFKLIFKLIEEGAPDQWNYGNHKEKGFIATNVGVSAVVLVVDDIIRYLRANHELKPSTMTSEQLTDEVQPYLSEVIKFINSLEQDEIQKLRSFFGSGAPPKIQRHFQNSIYTAINGFQPDGLLKWRTEMKGEYTRLAWRIVYEELEPLIREYIINEIKSRYGQENWWMEGVPDRVRKECAVQQQENRSTKQIDTFLYISSYHRIVEYNWDLLGNIFTEPGNENEKKAKKIGWMERMTAIRNKCSHPPSDPVTEEEYSFLEDTKAWLESRLV